MAWRGVALAAMAAVAGMAGCGGVVSPDLFIVYRTGSSPGAKLTMLVSEEGGVHCDEGAAHPSPERHLSDSQILEARTIQEGLEVYASQHESLPAQPGSVLAYYVRDANGSVRFSDNSLHQPTAMHKLALFVLSVAQGVCHLPQQGA